MSISIILPVYHEEKNILKVLEQIQKAVKTDHEILIIYDSKSDPTYSVLKMKKNISFQLLQNDKGNKKGIINAIKTGFFYSKGKAVVVVMSDLADDVRQIDTMYKHIQEGSDIVCASRYMKGGKKLGGGILKSCLSQIAGLSLYYFFGVATHDATNAYKMYRKSIFNTISIESKEGFVYSLEIVIKAHKKGLRITEIPTVWKDREEGKSQFRLTAWLPTYIKTYATIFS